MNETLKNIYFLEKQLNDLSLNVKHKSTLYSNDSNEVIEASKLLDSHLFYPHINDCYWFIYKSKINPKISIRVKGPAL